MGCCLSTTSTTAPKPNYPNATPPTDYHHFPMSEPKTRSPPPLEEETVKEVVHSETTISTLPAKNPSHTSVSTTKKPEVKEPEIEPVAEIKPTTEEIVSEMSEASEMYSYTESFSTTLTERKDEDDGEVSQMLVERSPAKVTRRRPYAGNKPKPVGSTATRSAPSLEKKSLANPQSRLAQGRNVGTTQKRNVGPQNGIRRDSGECSGRRSRSPAPRGEVGTRSNVRRKSPSPGPSLNRTGRANNTNADNNERKLEKPNDDVSSGTPSESIDDPHVSLECFIFL